MALFSAGSSLTCHLAPFVLNVITTSLPCILPLVVFPRLCHRPSTLRHVHYPLPLSKVDYYLKQWKDCNLRMGIEADQM